MPIEILVSLRTLAAVTALGAWLGFANPLLHFPPAALCLPLGLAFIGFRAIRARQALKAGWLAGTLAAAGCLYWIVVPVSLYGELPWYLALPCPVLVSMVLGAYFGLYSLAMHWAGRKLPGPCVLLLAGACWVLVEQLASFFLSGFPWLSLSAAFAVWPAAVQAASLVGAYGLSGLLACLAVSVLLWNTFTAARVLATGLTLFLALFGAWRMQSFTDEGRPLSLLLVQGNVEQSLKWDLAYQSGTVDKYLGLSRAGLAGLAAADPAKPKPDLVVWPETALPFYFQDPTPLRHRVAAFVEAAGLPLLTGAPGYVTLGQGPDFVLYNRAFLLDDRGLAAGTYDKEHLVPFGEYMPLGELVPLGKLLQGVGDFSPGRDQRPLRLGGVALGLLICYEAIFPGLAQERVAQGANLLVNLSNDAWFGETSAPRQHLNLARLRSVEQSRWLVRCTNTGITCAIDPLGRIRAEAARLVPLSLHCTVAARDERTAYHRLHWLWNFGPLALAIGLFAWGCRRGRAGVRQ